LGGLTKRSNSSTKPLRIDGNYPEAHYKLGRLLAQLGQREQAVAHFTEALRLNPDYADVKEQLRELGVER
jgi:tetratricopeptide (TPR) repeat protein